MRLLLLLHTHQPSNKRLVQAEAGSAQLLLGQGHCTSWCGQLSWRTLWGGGQALVGCKHTLFERSQLTWQALC